MFTSTLSTNPRLANAALQSAAASSATTRILTGSSSAAGAVSAAAAGSSSSSGSAMSKAMSLTPNDFVNMMITQLKNQDPMQPASNADLLQQMSQIGQLQSQDQLQSSLKGMVLQNQIGSAATLIGKSVKGLDADSNPVGGVVNSVHVETDGVKLDLDDGTSLPLGNVTDINTVATPGGATTGTTAAASAGAATATSAKAA